MERKTKHRILGILVVIGLVIILLPFFQGAKDISTDTALVAAPPFPDQPVQVASTAGDQKVLSPQISQPTVNPSQPPKADSSNTIKQQPDDTISAIHPSIVNNAGTENQSAQTTPNVVQTKEEVNKKNNEATELPSSPAVDTTNVAVQPTSNQIVKTAAPKTGKANSYKIIEDIKRPVVKNAVHITKSVPAPKARLASAARTPVEDGLLKIKSAAWVIQIGSYKNKANALRMVNQLRANGYRAFIQQISTALGDHTRVFVGPENKRLQARALADRLQSEMHIQGIVISYKPLTL